MTDQTITALTALKKSKFRFLFELPDKDRQYIQTKGIDTIHSHIIYFITTRLAPAFPKNDGKQTPMRGHLVFIAQHATATCCRGCLWKWHRIEKGQVRLAGICWGCCGGNESLVRFGGKRETLLDGSEGLLFFGIDDIYMSGLIVGMVV